MAAHALCPRFAPLSSLNYVNVSPTEARDTAHVPARAGNKPTKPPKQQRWEPLDLEDQTTALENNTWTEPDIPAADLPTSSRLDPLRGPKNPRQSSCRRSKKKMGSATEEEHTYVPPHLRGKPQYVPPHKRGKAHHVPPHQRHRKNASAIDNPPTNTPAGIKGTGLLLNQQNDESPQEDAKEDTLGSPEQNGTDGATSAVHVGAVVPSNSNALPSPPYSTNTLHKLSPPATDKGTGKGRSSQRHKTDSRANNHPFRLPNNSSMKPRRTGWLKSSEIKALPDNESDGGVKFCNGWENWEEDSYNAGQLHDWNGDWLPPPVERNPYIDPNLMDTIDKWMQQVWRSRGPEEDSGFVPHKEDPFIQQHYLPGEKAVIDKTWLPKQIEGESPHQFWRSFPARAPDALTDIDITKNTPWWDSVPHDHSFLPHLAVPEATVDPDDEGSRLPGYTGSVNRTVTRKECARAARNRKLQEKRNQSGGGTEVVFAVRDSGLKPTANIYLRPGLPEDVVAVTELYNHYVKESVCTNEFKERTPEQIVRRMTDIVDQGLPWIVAVQKSLIKGRSRFDIPGAGENIVGFAAIDDYCDPGSMYRYTFELEIFVHHEHLHQGVGKCLMDRMMTLVNPAYMSKGGYDWLPRTDYLQNGLSRVVKVINFSFPHANDPAEKEKLEAVITFVKMFGFRKAGHLYGIGYKHDKCVDVSLFQMTTSEVINAGATPMVPL